MSGSEPSRPPWSRGDVAVAVGVSVVGLTSATLLAGSLAIAAGWIPTITRPDFGKLSTADLASIIAAAATLLLADFTALLAWFTRRSIAATQREADIAQQALAASNRHADIADETLKAVQAQAAIAERQVDATNAQARIAQEQLAASWRPLLAEPRPRARFGIPIITTEQPFRFQVRFVNIGAGPAFVAKALLSLGAAVKGAETIAPKIVPAGDSVFLNFDLWPQNDPVDLAIGKAFRAESDLSVTVLYEDISGERAWRSHGRLISPGVGENERELTDLEVSIIDKEFLT